MANKQTPQTAEAYAKYLYMADRADGDKVTLMNGVQIIDCRVRAFMDGVSWAKRRAVRERALRKPKRR